MTTQAQSPHETLSKVAELLALAIERRRRDRRLEHPETRALNGLELHGDCRPDPGAGGTARRTESAA